MAHGRRETIDPTMAESPELDHEHDTQHRTPRGAHCRHFDSRRATPIELHRGNLLDQRWLGKFGQKSFWDKWKDLLID